MKLGMMNDPRANVLDEIRWAGTHGLEFLDLTVEGPSATIEQLDAPLIRKELQAHNLDVIGHTAWYLPFSSPINSLRKAAVDEVVRTFPLFSELEARFVNVHIGRGVDLYSEDATKRFEADSFAHLAEAASRYGLTIVVEHAPARFSDYTRIEDALAADSRLGFHLDVGHAAVAGLKLDQLLARTKGRLCHVHFSDNRGARDDHMPIGAGTIDWDRTIQLLQEYGYDETITLEVFSSDRRMVVASAEKVRELWAKHSSRR